MKKCIPITRSGRADDAASFVSDIDEVFEAKIESLEQTSSSRFSSADLISISSTIASTTRVRSARS